ncbi:MAG: RnfABCDGE type electron transport complex subunit D [Aeromicrobium sp.]|jgi:electron transport complex protein RnfD|nr:RnfABCDGE type electron transport complex subunit D [Aeromicrobium sp.]
MAGLTGRRVVGPSPHIKEGTTCTSIMLWVVAALAPSALWAVVTMGWVAAQLLIVCIVVSLATEYGANLLARRPQTLTDGSALVTGLLLAMSLPPRTPWWVAAAAAIIAIGLAKQLFGGLGHNLFNPALVGRAFVAVSWAGVLAAAPNRGWFQTLPDVTAEGLDTISGATRLAVAAADRAASGAYGFDLAAEYQPLLWKNLEGSLGEISAALLIAGGLLLIVKGIIDWRIPAGYIGTMAIVSLLFGADPVFHVLAGGVMLGAFYMATDYVSSPMSKSGRLAYGIGCGLFNAVGRFVGAMPESTTFAILFMNGLAPLIDRMSRPRTFGWVKRDA